MMNRKEFMKQLELLLSDIPEYERREALDYYESYFDEAGEAEEASVIQKLGSPGKVAAIIKADLRENSGYADGGDSCYEDGGEAGFTPEERQADRRERGYQPREKKGRGKIALILILLVLLSPFLVGMPAGVLGLIALVIFFPLVLVLLSGLLTFGFLVAGICVIFSGIGLCFSFLAEGIYLIGAGCIVMALGLVGLVFMVWVFGSLFPRFLRWFTDSCHRLLNRERKDGRCV